jgi:cytochrome P450
MHADSIVPVLRGLPFLGVALPIHRDAIGFFTRAFQRYGDRVELRVLGKRVLLLSDPADVEAVLVNDRDSYGRSTEVRNLRPIFGDGLLSSEGDLWRKQRRLIQPAFSHERILQYSAVMLASMERQISGWRVGEVREICRDMAAYTRDVICNTMFGQQPSADAETIARLVTIVFREVRAEILYLSVWQNLPLPRSIRWSRAVRALGKAITRMIDERRRAGELGSDLLGLLLSAQGDDGSEMSSKQVQDEVLTMFLAGQETSALALSWAVYLLAVHPNVQEDAVREVARITGNRGLNPGDYPALRLVGMIIQEALRLYPPVWSLGRDTVRDTIVNGLLIRAGTRIWICTRQIQRDARWFSDPEEFNPHRWAEKVNRPKFSYFPFGGGPRMCIGHHFATTEAVLGLAAVLSRFRFSLAPEARIQTEAWMTLRPRHGIHVRIAS